MTTVTVGGGVRIDGPGFIRVVRYEKCKVVLRVECGDEVEVFAVRPNNVEKSLRDTLERLDTACRVSKLGA